ncbi:hypothetical protein CANMA_002390 [Candida margitis]|uniref:uncharacterized protein n=1 Tax=Candida margitis TaxID=1775924 RepID=UPI0022272F27|nr:uncharacterized protein CANMA_002390 [Candida margitis]KAI5968399.1 hypothetical protein CANMA_002390 [Candida margitis]
MSPEHSHRYTRTFIDSQLSLLRKPLVIDESVSEVLSNQESGISQSQLQDILNKVNASLNTRYDEIFSPQRNNQVIERVAGMEIQNLLKVDQQIFKIHNQLQDFDVSGFNTSSTDEWRIKLQRLGEMIRNLPEPKYLYLLDNGGNLHYSEMKPNTDCSERVNIALSHQNNCRQNEQVQSERSTRKIELSSSSPKSSSLKVTDGELVAELLAKYTRLRSKLTTLSDTLQYNFDKLEYLRGLNTKMNETFSAEKQLTDSTANKDESPCFDNLQEEFDRFRILVEKIAYKSSLEDLRSS